MTIVLYNKVCNKNMGVYLAFDSKLEVRVASSGVPWVPLKKLQELKINARNNELALAA